MLTYLLDEDLRELTPCSPMAILLGIRTTNNFPKHTLQVVLVGANTLACRDYLSSQCIYSPVWYSHWLGVQLTDHNVDTSMVQDCLIRVYSPLRNVKRPALRLA
jgi:hypothetical protein